MRELLFLSCNPNTLYYVWQVNLWLESAQKYGISSKCHILIYLGNKGEKSLDQWKIVQDLYPEASFFFYDGSKVKNYVDRVYIPVLRPYTLSQHFKQFPELKDKAIFYHDCDIIFNRALDIDKYVQNDINYVSDSVSRSDYMSHKYFLSKRNDVLPDKLEEYDKRNILAETAKIVGISEAQIVDNYKNTGGAQYLLKNIDHTFWDYVQSHSIEIVLYLNSVNRKFFINGDKGFQSWCADMWAVLWGLWVKGDETRVVPEMGFAWATDEKDKLDIYPILHNAGVTSDSTIRTLVPDGKGGKIHIDAPAFYKGRYHSGHKTPFNDEEYTNNVLNHPISSNYCFHQYLTELLNIKSKYNLSY